MEQVLEYKDISDNGAYPQILSGNAVRIVGR